MTKHEKELFYIGAAVYLDLDSEEIDEVLSRAGLNPDRNTVRECVAAVKERYPDRYERGKRQRALTPNPILW